MSLGECRGRLTRHISAAGLVFLSGSLLLDSEITLPHTLGINAHPLLHALSVPTTAALPTGAPGEVRTPSGADAEVRIDHNVLCK
jgi:hypothetical protein